MRHQVLSGQGVERLREPLSEVRVSEGVVEGVTVGRPARKLPAERRHILGGSATTQRDRIGAYRYVGQFDRRRANDEDMLTRRREEQIGAGTQPGRGRSCEHCPAVKAVAPHPPQRVAHEKEHSGRVTAREVRPSVRPGRVRHASDGADRSARGGHRDKLQRVVVPRRHRVRTFTGRPHDPPRCADQDERISRGRVHKPVVIVAFSRELLWRGPRRRIHKSAGRNAIDMPALFCP